MLAVARQSLIVGRLLEYESDLSAFAHPSREKSYRWYWLCREQIARSVKWESQRIAGKTGESGPCCGVGRVLARKALFVRREANLFRRVTQTADKAGEAISSLGGIVRTKRSSGMEVLLATTLLLRAGAGSDSPTSRNGLRDIGRGEGWAGFGNAVWYGSALCGRGDAARLRKGLLEDKFRDRPTGER